jgi:hypothetical protein
MIVIFVVMVIVIVTVVIVIVTVVTIIVTTVAISVIVIVIIVILIIIVLIVIIAVIIMTFIVIMIIIIIITASPAAQTDRQTAVRLCLEGASSGEPSRASYTYRHVVAAFSVDISSSILNRLVVYDRYHCGRYRMFIVV